MLKSKKYSLNPLIIYILKETVKGKQSRNRVERIFALTSHSKQCIIKRMCKMDCIHEYKTTDRKERCRDGKVFEAGYLRFD